MVSYYQGYNMSTDYSDRDKSYFAKWAKAKYHKLANSRICTICGKVAPRPGKKTCQLCQDMAYIRTKRYREKARQVIREHYGRICECCGEANDKFLTIDHINNDGSKQRKSFSSEQNFYHHVAQRIKAGNAPTDLRLLCFNCNSGRQLNGGICPHQESIA